jgi:hypothetical protein
VKATGIRMSDGSVGIAELKGSKRSPWFARYERVTIDPQAGPGEAVSEAFRRNGFSGGRVWVSLPGEHAIVRRLEVPLSNARAAAKAARFQAEDFLCGDTLEDVLIEEEVLGPTPGGGTEVLVLIVRKAEVGSALEALGKAGIEAAGVTLDEVALFNLASAAGEVPAQGRAAILAFDGPCLSVVLSRDGRMEVVRRARIAGPGADGPPAEAAGLELARTLAGLNIEDPLARIVLVGDGAEPSASSLSSRFLAPVSVLDPGKSLGGGAGDGSADAAAAAGAALQGLGGGVLPLDFRKGEFAPAGERRRVWTRALFALAALAALFGALLAGALQTRAQKKAYLDDLAREAERNWKKVFPQKPFPRVGFDRYILTMPKKPAGKAESVRHASFLEALKKVSDALPGEGVSVQGIQFDSQKLILNGEVEDLERLDGLVRALEARFGARVKPQLERRGRGEGGRRTTFKAEIPLPAAK